MNTTFPSYQFMEVLHKGIHTIIYRAERQSDKASVVIKALKSKYPTIEELTRLRHEYKILGFLADIEGIVKPLTLENHDNGLALILSDFGAISLKAYMSDRTLEITEFLKIAIQLASTLAQLHHHQIIHKDIKPNNIVINPETREVKLIDFSIASQLERENSTLSHPDLLEGTLAYMSPEQTGRMNRAIDYRTDFYSLGITFYEMLTGQLPFNSIEPLELVHSHIAKMPVPPHHLNSEIPEAISKIVMKLVAKTAEERYQSAEGLKFDLENCLIELQATGAINNFFPGRADKAGQLIIPQKLYGRSQEVDTLLATFERVATGTTELMLVSGYSGIGKTVLVNEVHKPIVRQRGYFIAGKFDQFKRNIPFASLIQAFQSLIQQLLTETEAQILLWKEKLLAALFANGQVIIDVIPEIELIIGKQPPVSELGATEAQNRFSRVFQQFISVFTTKEHPLVVFLDDLQWADSASLKLIELLMTDRDSQYFLLIGAYRDNEVFPAHPTIQTIEKIEQAKATVNNIVLSPLQLVHVEELIAETLNETVLSKSLAELLFNKTQGNPFFLTQLLKTLYQEDLLVYDLYSSAWQWDIKQIQAIGITDYNVVELIARNIRKLSEDTQKVLKLAACIGNTFNLEVLSVVNEESSLVTAAQLWSALQAGLILPQGNEYKIPLVFSQEEASGFTLTDVKVDYKFLHDRVQQAAYSLIPDDEKKQKHLKIGQLLLHSTTPEERKENIFALVNQLNYGTDLLTKESERYELAQLNLIAGQKAKAATAYESAVKYLNVGLGLLDADSWNRQYDLTLSLYLEAAEAEFISTNFERSQQLSAVILQEAKTLLETIKVYELKIQFDIAGNRSQSAIDTGLSVLEMFGVSLDQEPPQQLIIEDLADLPLMTDRDKLAAMRILSSIVIAAYLGNGAMLPSIVFTMIKLSVEYGNSPESAFAYVFYGCLLCGSMGDIESGYRYGKLAVVLLEKFQANSLNSKILLIFNAILRAWKDPVRESLEPLLVGMHSGLEFGDLECACHCAFNYSYMIFLSDKELEKVEREQEKYVAITIKYKQEYDTFCVKIYQQLIKNFLGKAPNKYQLIGESFNEEEMVPLFRESNNGTLLFLYYAAKTILLYSFKDYEGTVASANLATEYANYGVGLIQKALYNFYHSLALLALYPNADSSQKKAFLSEVAANQEQMKIWTYHAPANFQHKYDLVEAVKYGVLGLQQEAMDYYERAISGAKEQRYLQDETLANELAAEFQLSLGREKIAKTYMTDAYYGYIHWGAKAKVEDLEERYPQLLAAVLNQKTGETMMQTIQGTITSSTSGVSQVLDLATVMKASQAISSEIVLANLLDKLMKILIENAGAETGALILSKDEQFFLAATGNKDEIQVLESPLVSTTQPLPISVLNYVARTQKDVVLDDAIHEQIFNNDPYITQHRIKSILCTPILNQGKLIAILYLENNLIAGAFTPKRVEVLQMLSGQAAIALENARLYADLESAKQQLEAYSHTLEAKVQERTQELQEKNIQLQTAEATAQLANRAKSDFLANMSHELRTPLNGILGYTQILQRDKNITGVQKEGLNIIHQCSDHLLNLISDILDLSKIEARKMELHPIDFHFPEFLEGIAEICRIRAEQKGISLIYEQITQLPTGVKADEKRLRQVLINILGNAVKFTETGGVAFKVGYHKDKIRFQVEDTGVGMAPEQLEEIFLPFQQVGDRSRQAEGTGLGLAITRQLVQLMGGEIQVRSTLGQGTIFFFDLDLPEVSEWAKNSSMKLNNIQGFKGSKFKVIVADDKSANRSVLVKMLLPLGFEVLEAIDGQDCLTKVTEFNPDCILMDLMMPQISGLEATRRLKRSPELKDVVIIGTSASVFEFDYQKSKEAGCNDFLQKPIRFEDLLNKLQNHLGLEWIYENGSAIESWQTEDTLLDSTLQSQGSLVIPPLEVISFLLDLSMKGDIQGIVEKTNQLEKSAVKYQPFAKEIYKLAKSFQIKKIREFLKTVGKV